MDALSSLLEEGNFVGARIGNRNINHLLYADDLLVFGVPSITNCQNLMVILNTFAAASGLYINSEKSTLLTSKSIPHSDDIRSALNLHNSKDVITYLGIPIAYKRLKISDFHLFMEKVTKNLSGWNANLLSLAGRLQFLKYTMTNSIAYWIRGSILPKYVQKFFKKIASKFLFFGDALTGRKLHMVAWVNVCKPKSKGGLGLHSIPALIYGFNCSLILRFSNLDYPLASWITAKYGNPWQPPPRFVLLSGRLSVLLLMRQKLISHLLIMWKSVLRYSVFGWLALVGGLKTAVELSRRNIQVDMDCVFCHNAPESISHLFFDCNFSHTVLCNLIPAASSILLRPNIHQLFDWIAECPTFNEQTKCFYCIITCSVIYSVWRERNNRKFGNCATNLNSVCYNIKKAISLKVHKWKNSLSLLDGF
ncbi:hypothetical protein M5K25_014637 [Dendrobium thyrsiflorum]|uniref:Reverse transcriptase domain-containing protein n=1 Tax=Dendrobium thyrsiflorum TaxID=117978 RepID=A0ABD0UV76_DENTH